MDESLKITDQQHAVYLLALQKTGIVQFSGVEVDKLSGRVWLKFSPKEKALEELQSLEKGQSPPIQPKNLLDCFYEFKNIIRKTKEGIL